MIHTKHKKPFGLGVEIVVEYVAVEVLSAVDSVVEYGVVEVLSGVDSVVE
jgi:hypothetical protein